MRTTVRWFTGVCVLLVALPTAPCAWISQGCPFEAGGLLEGRDPAPRSCCASHSAGSHSAGSDATASTDGAAASRAPAKPAAPCTRDCCKVRSLPPVPEKVIAEQPILPLLVASVDTAIGSSTVWTALDCELHPLDPSLQILHCQWRL